MEYGVIWTTTNSELAYYEELAVRDSENKNALRLHVYFLGQDYIITTIDATITNRDTEPSCMNWDCLKFRKLSMVGQKDITTSSFQV